MDKRLMRQVVSNLISNAIKYSAAKSPIRVLIRQTKEEITLFVKDKGIGIPQEDMTHLFTPFFRGSNTGNLPGTGLGLNIVKESVNLHGGSMTVESKVSEGTTFTVSFPIERHLKKE
jgi:signal transduction histidine kinase